MKKIKFNKVLIVVLGFVFTISLAGLTIVKAIGTAVDLGTAEDFAVLAGSAITDANDNAGIDIIGDVGLSPTPGSFITELSCTQVTGTIYDVDDTYTGGFDTNDGCLVTDAGLLTTAKDDLVLAYNDAEGQASDFALVASGTDSFPGTGYTLEPGVYTSGSTIGVTGTLTLDGGGDPDAVFIFQAGSSLTTATDSEIILINEAQACNVFWQVGSDATLGTTTDFVGTIMAVASITDDGGSTVLGRLLADADDNTAGAVTLSDTTITVPTCVSAATLNVIKVIDGGGAVASDFQVYVQEGGVDVTGSPAGGAGGLGTAYSLSAGTYVISEDNNNSYDESFSGDCNANGSITLVAGTDYTCTITNTYNPPSSGGSSGSSSRPNPATLHVIKQVVNNSGGTLTASAFNLHVKLSGTDVLGSPAVGTAIPGTIYSLSPGTYVVSEDAANGSYVQSFSGDCDLNGSVTLSSGDNETCTITNDDIAPGVVSFVPGLPKTGFPPQEKNTALPIVILFGLSAFSTFLYFAQKKPTT